MTRQTADQTEWGDLTTVQAASIEHALTVGGEKTGFLLAGVIERLRSHSSASRCDQTPDHISQLSGKPGLLLTLTALATVYAETHSGEFSERLSRTLKSAGCAPGIDTPTGGTATDDPPPDLLGAAVAHERFDVPLARAADVVGRQPEAVARACRQLRD